MGAGELLLALLAFSSLALNFFSSLSCFLSWIVRVFFSFALPDEGGGQGRRGLEAGGLLQQQPAEEVDRG